MNLKLSLIVSVLAISLFSSGCTKKEEQQKNEASPANVKSTHLNTDTSHQPDPSADLAAVSKANLGEGETASSTPTSFDFDKHNTNPHQVEEKTHDPMAEINSTSNKIISESEKTK